MYDWESFQSRRLTRTEIVPVTVKKTFETIVGFLVGLTEVSGMLAVSFGFRIRGSVNMSVSSSTSSSGVDGAGDACDSPPQ